MGLKIKWNDDRVKGATTALLLISRDRLRRGQTENLVEEALAEYRADPDGYKASKAAWPDVNDVGPLKKASHVAYYKNLLTAVDELLKRMAQIKRQSNSLLELDNYLIASLRNVQ